MGKRFCRPRDLDRRGFPTQPERRRAAGESSLAAIPAALIAPESGPYSTSRRDSFGRATTGSPWWVDTFNVAPGDSYEIAFRADNPGVWMGHCHNLPHAAKGMTMHLAYEGITSPYEVGPATVNHPD